MYKIKDTNKQRGIMLLCEMSEQEISDKIEAQIEFHKRNPQFGKNIWIKGDSKDEMASFNIVLRPTDIETSE